MLTDFAHVAGGFRMRLRVCLAALLAGPSRGWVVPSTVPRLAGRFRPLQQAVVNERGIEVEVGSAFYRSESEVSGVVHQAAKSECYEMPPRIVRGGGANKYPMRRTHPPLSIHARRLVGIAGPRVSSGGAV